MPYKGVLEIMVMPESIQKNILLQMKTKNITLRQLSAAIDVSYWHLNHCLYNRHPLTNKNQEKINKFLNTNF